MQAVRKTEDLLGFPQGSLLTKSRERRYVDARNVLMFYFTKYLRMTVSDAGSMLNRNHATCIHSLKSYKALYDTSKEFRSFADNIIANVGRDRLEEHKHILIEALQQVEKERSRILEALQSFE
jgi:hypothetical protein